MSEYKVLTEDKCLDFATIETEQIITGEKTFSNLTLNISEQTTSNNMLGCDSNIVKFASAASVGYATTAGSAPANDVPSWAKASSKPSYSWSEITGKPTFRTVTYSTTEPSNSQGNNGDLWVIIE